MKPPHLDLNVRVAGILARKEEMKQKKTKMEKRLPEVCTKRDPCSM